MSQTLALRTRVEGGDAVRPDRKGPPMTTLLVLVVASLFLSVGLGSLAIHPGQVLGIFAHQLGIEAFSTFEPRHEAVLLGIRLPRALLAMLVGAGLGIAGAAMQGLFRNPLADPGLIGVSSGAAFAAASAIVLGSSLLNGALGAVLMPTAAFVGSLVTTVLVWRIAQRGGRVQVATMLLAGIALNALTGAGTGALTLIASEPQLRSITFWSLGSLNGASWTTLWSILPFVGLAIVVLPRLSRALNALLLGEAEAQHLGVRIERVKHGVIVLTALAVGASVAVAGLIGFIGLVAPHLVRLLWGPDHRTLLPGAALMGALLLSVSDLLSRTLIAPAELPVGILTALMGAPFFLWLLLRSRGMGSQP